MLVGAGHLGDGKLKKKKNIDRTNLTSRRYQECECMNLLIRTERELRADTHVHIIYTWLVLKTKV